MTNVFTKKEDCCGCGACAQKCPNECIIMKADGEGFLYPEIDTGRCTKCGACETSCFVSKYRPAAVDYEIYAAKNKDEEIRFQSSSGGMFSLIAEEIIEQGGAVFGAGFDKGFAVRHSAAHTKEGLRKFRKSKYVQSDTGNTFSEAKAILGSGKKVLFSGTPCQIAGLKAFLGGEYDNLYTVDLICTGVSSPKVWDMYLSELANGAGSGIESVTFRNKEIDSSALSPNQGNITFRAEFENGTGIYQHAGIKRGESAFFEGYLKKLYLRPSCHKCAAKGFTSGSDIQLGDFWGIHRLHPEFCDKHPDGTIMPFGVSEVIAVSEKGKELFRRISDKAVIHGLDRISEKKYNWHYVINSAKPNPSREAFFSELSGTPEAEISNLIRKHVTGFDPEGLIKRQNDGDAKLVLFGAGDVGRSALPLLQSFGCRVDYFCDNMERLWGGEVSGIPVIGPAELAAMHAKSNVAVYISSTNYFDEIGSQLAELGITAINDTGGRREKGTYYFRRQYSTVRDWLYKKQLSRSLDKHLIGCGYKEIAIYSMGEIGQLLLWELQGSEISVKYAIDERPERKFAEVSVIKPDDGLPGADAIVVCEPAYFEEIKQSLAAKTNIPAVSIDKLIYEA